MICRVLSFVAGAACAALLAGCGPGQSRFAREKPKPDVSFKPREMTDALHAVIAADRAVYVEHVLERARASGLAQSGESWRDQKNLLPLHADMLKMASQQVQSPGAEFHYALRSLEPLNPRNLPQTETERAGLEQVAANPAKTFYSEEFLGGRRYFTAVYPDHARWRLCLDCHHSKGEATDSPTLGEVLGGIVVRVPLEF